MTLDPAWFNALVDDPGPGTTGTVWNKAAINGLLTNVNSELTRIDLDFPTWTPTIVGNGGGTPAYSLQIGWCARIAKRLAWVGFRLVFTKGSIGAGALSIKMPLPAGNTGSTLGGVSISVYSGLAIAIAGLNTYSNANGDLMTLVYIPAAGATNSLNYLLDTHLGGGPIELWGSGLYLTT